MKKEQFSCIKPENRVDIKDYKGFKVRVNNLVKLVRVSRKHRIIEINSHTFRVLSYAQAHYLFEWCRRFARSKNEFIADEKAMKWAEMQGYDLIDIRTLYDDKTLFYNKESYFYRGLNIRTDAINKNIFKKFIKWIMKIK